MKAHRVAEIKKRLPVLVGHVQEVVQRSRAARAEAARLRADNKRIRSQIAEQRVEVNHWRGLGGLPPIERMRTGVHPASLDELTDEVAEARAQRAKPRPTFTDTSRSDARRLR
jgi:hypothetical protein